MNDQQEKCKWCGHLHGLLCPAVRAKEMDKFGNVRRIEFHTPKVVGDFITGGKHAAHVFYGLSK